MAFVLVSETFAARGSILPVNVVLVANAQRAARSLMKMASGMRYAPHGLTPHGFPWKIPLRPVKIGKFSLCSALGLRPV